MTRPPPRSTLFPYTTLFRSATERRGAARYLLSTNDNLERSLHSRWYRWSRHWSRSEEHTSELQSRFDLVCRLLLEKKKNKIYIFPTKNRRLTHSCHNQHCSS